MTDRPTVLVFATGGTIGMHETKNGLAPDPDFPAALESMVAGVCAQLSAEFRVNHQNPPIHSGNADAETAPRLASAIRSRVRTVRPRGAVILHGTDTLAYTAARLAFELDGLGAPVVITGAQLPYGATGTDALDNLRLAIRAALRAGADAPVSIAFGGALIPAVRATKIHTHDFAGFGATRELTPGAVGTANANLGEVENRTSARVISFRFVPGVTADDLRYAVGGAPDGLVLECYGSGSGPVDRPGMAEALREIADALPVVAVTQCRTGGVDLGRYAVGRRLAQCGVIEGGDMTLEAAIAKLSYALDRGAEGEELHEVMRLNLVGERAAYTSESRHAAWS